jgi:hypothetical protein
MNFSMHWNRSNSIGSARISCQYCHGNGTRFTGKGREVPCNCIFLAIFRACWNRFRECAASGAHVGTVSLDYYPGTGGHRIYSRKKEEFMADFCLVSRRVLDESEYEIFRYRFLLGADWKMCCDRLKLDRGGFFHSVYRIERKLGRAFAEIKPYPLYPLGDYFGDARRDSLPLSA